METLSFKPDPSVDEPVPLEKRIRRSLFRVLTELFVPRYEPSAPSSQRVAIIVPASSRSELLPEEEVSMRHLLHFLKPYDKYLIAPRGSGSSHRHDGFDVVEFPRKFFGSAAAHNRLLLWPQFYRRFVDYEYILMYHLDSLVFSDQLMQWCEAGFDYIGAPWVPCADTPWVKEARVGNGGFALMKIKTILRVLDQRYRQDPASYWLDLMMRNNSLLQPLFRFLEWLRPMFPKSRMINRPLEDLPKTRQPDIHGCQNDYFWSFEAGKFVPQFKLAPVEQGLRFAFEAAPRLCLELANGQLPFGCHAWAKFDRKFWEPHLLRTNGSAVPRSQ